MICLKYLALLATIDTKTIVFATIDTKTIIFQNRCLFDWLSQFIHPNKLLLALAKEILIYNTVPL